MSDVIVFTNGCFDILHRGHVEYLKQSRALGDKLVVGINSDESVRQLKPGRPINKQEDRKAVLEALRCVDEVIIFNELRPLELIKKVKPDIITKGGDYTVDQVSGDGIAKVIIIPFLNGYSSTGIINEINRVC
jgi:rfaE bifunctional protein nucleotidyltransferase chain/domain